MKGQQLAPGNDAKLKSSTTWNIIFKINSHQQRTRMLLKKQNNLTNVQ